MGRNPEAIAAAIREADSIALCSHVNPDGDTIGCILAMRLGLMALGKRVSAFCQDKVPDNLAFLPGAAEIHSPVGCEERFDLLLSVDVSDRARLGTGERLMAQSTHTAQIDHHPTNPLFMEVNSVDGEAPAACLLVYEQLKTLEVPLNRDIATCLYTGISTDTGNFSFASTNAETFRVMSELMAYDLPLSEVNRRLFRERSRAQVLLLGRALSKLRFEGRDQVAVTTLTQQDFADCGALKEHADIIVNYGLETTGTRFSVFGREDGGDQIKFSLRAKEPDRVDDLAQALGGGGHPQAAGVNLPGPLEDALARVLSALEKKL